MYSGSEYNCELNNVQWWYWIYLRIEYCTVIVNIFVNWIMYSSMLIYDDNVHWWSIYMWNGNCTVVVYMSCHVHVYHCDIWLLALCVLARTFDNKKRINRIVHRDNDKWLPVYKFLTQTLQYNIYQTSRFSTIM